MTTKKTLLLAPRYDDDSQLLWREAVKRGWGTERLDYVVSPLHAAKLTADGRRPAIYGGHIWGETIARQLDLTLMSPLADWLAHLPYDMVKRGLRVTTLQKLTGEMSIFPRTVETAFIKSLDWPQHCTSRVYYSLDDLPSVIGNVHAPILVSEPVKFTREFRAFVLDHEIAAFSPYARGPEGTLDVDLSRADVSVAETCHAWLSDALMEMPQLPRAVVVDVGMLESGEVAVVEANPAWCSGLYRCDPSRVLDVIEAATVTAAETATLSG